MLMQRNARRSSEFSIIVDEKKIMEISKRNSLMDSHYVSVSVISRLKSFPNKMGGNVKYVIIIY